MTIKPISEYTLSRILDQEEEETKRADERAGIKEGVSSDRMETVLVIGGAGVLAAGLCALFSPWLVAVFFGYGSATYMVVHILRHASR